MKAVMIKKDGFRKYIEVQKKVPYYSTINMPTINFLPYEEYIKRYNELEVPVTMYMFDRQYRDGYDNIVLIYKEE